MLEITAFSGRYPKLHPRILPNDAAQTCQNARMRDGALTPFRGLATDTTLAVSAARIYNHDSAWIGLDDSENVVPGPINANRLYFAKLGVDPYMIDNDASPSPVTYTLALPGPVSAPTLAVQSGTPDADTAVATAFAFTWVTSLDEESPPSDLTTAEDYSTGMVLRLSSFPSVPAGRAIDRMRIYRSVTDFAGATDLYLVAEVAIGTDPFDYDDDTYPIAEAIPSTDYDTPVTGLRQFTNMPNGMMAAYKNQVVYFCEPYKPHAWPVKYSVTTDFQIVGMSSFGSTLVVMTKGSPYIIQGAHPANMTMAKVENNYACRSQDGIVDLGYAVAYPSNDGLVVIDQNGANLVTSGLFGREEWNALRPGSFFAALFEQRYTFLYDSDGSGTMKMGMIDLSSETPFYITCDLGGIALHTSQSSGDLFVLNADGVTIENFDGSNTAYLEMTWRSKKFFTKTLTNFGAIRFDVDEPDPVPVPVTWSVTVYGDGALIHTETVQGAPQRLPGGKLCEVFEIEIVSDNPVSYVAVAESMLELMAP